MKVKSIAVQSGQKFLQTEWGSFSEEMMALKFLDEYFILYSMP
jgi:hypothetical protein